MLFSCLLNGQQSSMWNSPASPVLLPPREESSFSKSTPSTFTAFKPEDRRLFHYFLFCSLGEWKGVSVVILGISSLSSSIRKGRCRSWVCCPSRRTGRACQVFPSNPKDPWFPPVTATNQGHLLHNALCSHQIWSPWFSRYLLLGYVFQLCPVRFLSLWEWRLQR